MRKIAVKMFGSFTISSDDSTVSNIGNRSRKAWILMAYLICNRDRFVNRNELIDLLWGSDEDNVNPVGALKTLVYRARGELDKLWDGAGRDLILSSGEGYRWNDEFPVYVDCEDFGVVAECYEDTDRALEKLSLYTGEFLRDFGSELWVMSLGAHYHNLFINVLGNIAPVLIDAGRADDLIAFWPTVSQIEPYNEAIICIYMRAYINAGKQKTAIDIYVKLKEKLLSDLGILPSDETRALYHEAKKINNYHTISVERLKDQLRETDSPDGAMICEYDFFRVLYHSMARSVLRSGIAVHIALIIMLDKNGNELPAKKLERAMGNLEEVVRTCLRRGDSAAKCSSSQFVIMLPTANYENSCMVCERIIKAYNRKYAYTDTMIRYEVCPLDPDEKETFRWV